MVSKEPTRKDLLLIRLQCLLGKYSSVLIVNESKGLQKVPKVVAAGGGTPGELRMAKTLTFGQRILLFLDPCLFGQTCSKPASKVSGKCPKTLWKCLWTTQKFTENFSKLNSYIKKYKK